MNIPKLAENEELFTRILENFTEQGLERIIKFSLREDLASIVAIPQPLDSIVFELLKWVDMSSLDRAEPFLRGLLKARPADPLIRQFCQDNFPDMLTEIEPVDLVRNVGGGLRLLTELSSETVVQETVGSFRADFETTRDQIKVLRSYKALHDSLHNLQLRLDAISDAVMRMPMDASARGSLGIYAVDLKDEVDRAKARAAEVPSKRLEVVWIADFENSVGALKAAANAPNANGLEGLVEELRGLLRESPRINSALANVAASLRLDSLIEAMRTITGTLEEAGAETDAARKRLNEGLTALSRLRQELIELVEQHYEWQWVDKELTAAELSGGDRPEDRIPRWPQVRERLTALCDLMPDADWSRELKTWMRGWENGAPNKQINMDSGFMAFQRTAMIRFFHVDTELKSLCEELTQIAGPLNGLLEAVKT